ncbi:MAG: hypothetical protein LBT14_10440 [Treponema sp.]|jgi:hypothetical protein|nr:hypothetical protein [Treponema sp.]
MIRIEIVANHSVEENILEAFRDDGVGKFYTKYPSVYGVGSAGPHMGDAVWPEENFALVVWCEEDEARGIERAVASVKEHFPGEGIKLFRLQEAVAVQRTGPVACPQAVPATPPAVAPAAETALPGRTPGAPPAVPATPPPPVQVALPAKAPVATPAASWARQTVLPTTVPPPSVQPVAPTVPPMRVPVVVPTLGQMALPVTAPVTTPAALTTDQVILPAALANLPVPKTVPVSPVPIVPGVLYPIMPKPEPPVYQPDGMEEENS